MVDSILHAPPERMRQAAMFRSYEKVDRSDRADREEDMPKRARPDLDGIRMENPPPKEVMDLMPKVEFFDSTMEPAAANPGDRQHSK